MGVFDRWLKRFIGDDEEPAEAGPVPPEPDDDEAQQEEELRAALDELSPPVRAAAPKAPDKDPLDKVVQKVRYRLTLDERGRRYAESAEFQTELTALDRGGRRRASDQLLADALLVSKDIGLRRQLAERLVDRGDTATARELLVALVEHPGHAVFAWTALGEIAEAEGDLTEALAAYQQVMAWDVTAQKAKTRARRLRATKEARAGAAREKKSALTRFLGAKAAGARYAVVDEIGRGGAATVFRATDRVTGREVALKIFHPRGNVTERRARLVEEAKVAGRFDHPHIVPILDIDPERDLLVMMMCDGGSLRQTLARGKLAHSVVIEMGAVLLRTLSDIHAAGEVHLDIKPSNVLFHQGRLMLCDFGTAGLHQLGRAAGTRLYMAPEQRTLGRASPAADLYATGLLLFEALTGHLPDKTQTGRPSMVLHDLPEGPRRRGMEHLLGRLCAREPQDRPATGAEAATDLLLYGHLPTQDKDAQHMLLHLEAVARQRGEAAAAQLAASPVRAVLAGDGA